jgi:hypothetical protein
MFSEPLLVPPGTAGTDETRGIRAPSETRVHPVLPYAAKEWNLP